MNSDYLRCGGRSLHVLLLQGDLQCSAWNTFFDAKKIITFLARKRLTSAVLYLDPEHWREPVFAKKIVELRLRNLRDEVLQRKESEVLRDSNPVPVFSADSKNANSSLTETRPGPSGIEIWRDVLAAARQVPKAQKHAFVVQVLVAILDGQEISSETLQEALRKGFECVQRVKEARQEHRP